MTLMDWHGMAACIAAGLMAGAVFWALARIGTLALERLPHRLAFAADVARDAGERDRRHNRVLGRELAALLGALLTAVIVAAGLVLSGWRASFEWPDWAWALLWAANAALFALAAYSIARLVAARRRARFSWAAKSAVGNALGRLNLSGNRVFNEVSVDGAVIDHVVLGTRGVFAVTVVARPVPRGIEGRPAAGLKNGKLALAGDAEALPVGDAARNMTLLSGALSKRVGHRVPVRSVLAVPGWDTVPNDKGNHLVLNERNLVTLTSWNRPDAYLMDEDCLVIQAFLAEASRATRFV